VVISRMHATIPKLGLDDAYVARASELQHTVQAMDNYFGATGQRQVEVRLGGIYSLERISKESPDDYRTVMNRPRLPRPSFSCCRTPLVECQAFAAASRGDLSLVGPWQARPGRRGLATGCPPQKRGAAGRRRISSHLPAIVRIGSASAIARELRWNRCLRHFPRRACQESLFRAKHVFVTEWP
jgi:hypothetical protein